MTPFQADIVIINDIMTELANMDHDLGDRMGENAVFLTHCDF